MYSVRYITKRGGSAISVVPNWEALNKKVKSLFKQRLEATAYEDDTVIGMVWKDDSQRLGWNWYLLENKN